DPCPRALTRGTMVMGRPPEEGGGWAQLGSGGRLGSGGGWTRAGRGAVRPGAGAARSLRAVRYITGSGTVGGPDPSPWPGVIAMPADRVLPSPEAAELIGLIRDVAGKEMAPRAAADEAAGAFPRDLFRLLGGIGLLGLPYPEEYGGAGQPYEVYLQALEEVASAWMTVGVGTSVHVLSCYPLFRCGTEQQRRDLLPELLAGDLLGGYCLSEAHAGSDVTAMRTRADRHGEEYHLHGSKAWITHGGQADFYVVFARTSEHRSRGISAFLVRAGSPGLSFGAPERKMGMTGSPTTAVHLDGVRVPADHRLGEEG